MESLGSDDDVLICTHASFRFAVEKYGVTAFDDRLIAIDEFHHVSANPDNRLGGYLAEFITRDKCTCGHDHRPRDGYDYGEGGYDPNKCNVGVNKDTGQIQLEIKGLAMPQSETAKRICREDLNELITSFVKDKQTMENGMFNSEMVPEELTQVKMGKIVQQRFPDLDGEDQEAVRQHAIAALNIIQQAKKKATGGGAQPGEPTLNLSLIEGVRKFCMDVKELEVLLHQFLAAARLDMELKDRFGYGVEPKEWFLAPLPVIQEVVKKLMDGTIGDFRYDAGTAQIVKR